MRDTSNRGNIQASDPLTHHSHASTVLRHKHSDPTAVGRQTCLGLCILKLPLPCSPPIWNTLYLASINTTAHLDVLARTKPNSDVRAELPEPVGHISAE